MNLDRRSEAVQPGTKVAVATTSTPVFDADDLDSGYKFILVNNSDADITIRLAASGAVAGEGIILKAAGGSYEEDRYAGAVCAIHAGTGSKDLAVVIV